MIKAIEILINKIAINQLRVLRYSLNELRTTGFWFEIYKEKPRNAEVK